MTQKEYLAEQIKTLQEKMDNTKDDQTMLEAIIGTNEYHRLLARAKDGVSIGVGGLSTKHLGEGDLLAFTAMLIEEASKPKIDSELIKRTWEERPWTI